MSATSLPASTEDLWLLPDGFDECMPEEAARIERLRRQSLDFADKWGYDHIMPPLVEFMDSLLIGTGADLDLRTFRLIDQASGRVMGVRADISPQIARFDAYQARICMDMPARYCYADSVLFANNEGQGSRSPLQFGAELFGCASLTSDLEILHLMLEVLELAGVADTHLSLGHVDVFRALVDQSNLSMAEERELFTLIQHKDQPQLEDYLSRLNIASENKWMLTALPDLNGDPDILSHARSVLSPAGSRIQGAVDYLENIAMKLRERTPNLPIHVDLAELRGYSYHTGIVFSAFLPGHGWDIARGGRYDGVGVAYGLNRPATGFSIDLKTIVQLLVPGETVASRESIFAPVPVDDIEGRLLIAQLRQQGKRVILALSDQVLPYEIRDCTHIMERDDAGHWKVVRWQT